MFFSRSRSGPTSQGLMGVSKSEVGGRAALESAFRISKTPTDKGNVTGELVDIKVDIPTEKEFSDLVSVNLWLIKTIRTLG